MKNNMSKIDRIIRAIIAIVIAALYFSNMISGGIGIVLMIIGMVFLLTAFINYCPLYSILGIRKWEKKSETKISGSN